MGTGHGVGTDAVHEAITCVVQTHLSSYTNKVCKIIQD